MERNRKALLQSVARELRRCSYDGRRVQGRAGIPVDAVRGISFFLLSLMNLTSLNQYPENMAHGKFNYQSILARLKESKVALDKETEEWKERGKGRENISPRTRQT